jgi:pentatricopeptide repeat protein
MGFNFLVENQATIIINGFDYQVSFSLLFFAIIFFLWSFCLFLATYLVAKIGNISFFTKSAKQFKKDYQDGLDLLALTLAYDAGGRDEVLVKNRRKIAGIFKNDKINYYFEAKIAQNKHKFAKFAEIFKKITQQDSENSRLVEFYQLLNQYQEQKNNQKATEMRQEILKIISYDDKIVSDLFDDYMANSQFLDAYELFYKYKFCEAFKGSGDKIVTLLTYLAHNSYYKRDYSKASDFAAMALKYSQFLPAQIILIKCYLKAKKVRKALSLMKKIWRNKPDLLIAKFYNFIYKNSAPEKRVKYFEKLYKLNSDDFIANVAFGELLINLRYLSKARNHLKIALIKKRSRKSYQLMARLENLETGDVAKINNYLQKANYAQDDHHYHCNNCGYGVFYWQVQCKRCAVVASFKNK